MKALKVWRLPTKSTTSIPNIIVRFKSRTDRDDFFSKRSGLKSVTVDSLGFTPTPATKKMFNKIYVNESLSTMSKELLRECRKRIKAAGYLFAFVSGGKVYIRKTKTSNKRLINTINDIDKFLPTTTDDLEP